MKTRNRILALLLSVLMIVSLLPMSVFAAGTDAEEPSASNGQFVIMSTTDMHGKVWDKNVLNDTAVSNSLLNVATAVKQTRDTYGAENVVLVDDGDLYQGTPVSSYNINLYTQGLTTDMNPMALALEYIDYDASILGNHEFNYSWDTMSDIYKHLNDHGVPTLACNIYYEATGERVMTPYITKTIPVDGHDFTVAVIGLENTDCTRWDVPDNYPGMRFSSPENPSLDVTYEVNKVLNEMKADGVGYDYLVVTYHSGLGSTGSSLVYGQNTENQVLRIIANCPEVDMIVAGHDHSSSYSNTLYKANADGSVKQVGKAGDAVDGSVLVVNGGGTGLTKSVFNVAYTEESGFSVSIDSSANLNLANYAKDEALKAIVEPYAASAEAYVNQSVGVLASNWDSAYGSYSNSKYYLVQSDTIDLINRTQIAEGTKYLNEKYSSVDELNAKLKEIYGEDTAKQYKGEKIQVDMSSTSIVSSSATKGGELTMKGIYGFYKYDNSLYLITMTGQEIKDLLEYNAANRLTARVANGEVSYNTTGDGFTNPVFYGLNFTYDMYKEEGNRAVISGFSNGKAFDLKETYIFAINNYHLGNAGNTELGKYTTEQAIWSQTDDMGGGYVQDLIADYVADMTAKYGQVYGSAESAKNGEVPSTWSLSYSGDLSKVEVSDKTTYIGKSITEPEDGDQVFFYCGYASGALGLDSGYNGRAVVGGSVIGNTGYADMGTALLTVSKVEGGYTFESSEGFLTSTGRNNLSYSKTATANSVWTIQTTDGGIYLKNTGSNVYLETYSGAITTYSTSKLNAQYLFGMYKVVTSAAKTGADAIEAGDNVVIYYDAGAAVVGGTSGTKMAAVNATTVDTKNSAVMEVPEGAAIFEIEKNADGKLLFKTADGYLTSGATGNSLTISATATDYSLWELEEAEGGYFIHNVNANYNGKTNQYLEYYSGFTTYGMNTSKASIYTFNLYKIGAMGADIPEPPVEGYVLPVFETSDVHGFIMDTSSGSEDTYQYRLAYIADKINDVRAGDNSKTLLLDGGDIYQGNTVSNLQMGQPLTAAYDLMKYDAVVIGNHEFDWGINKTVDPDGTMPAYSVGAYKGDSKVPVVTSNMTKDGEKITFAKDYVIVEKTATDAEGKAITVKIGVIGFVEDYKADIMTANFTGAGFKVLTDYSIANDLAQKLETEMGCDATVVITHAGAATVANGLGANTTVDLVCGGHTHKNTVGTTASGLNYIQPANQAQAYAYAELVFAADENGKVSGVSINDAKTVGVTDDKTKLYDVSANAEDLDNDVLELSRQSVAEVYDTLHEELGYVTTAVTKTGIGGNSSTAGNWMTSLMARSVDADVAFTNNGGIRTELTIPEGQEMRVITASDIYTISPFCNAIYCYEITYEELLGVLNYAVSKSASSLALRMSGIDCYYGSTVNTLVTADGTVIYNNGEWAEGWAEKTLKVATNEYVATSAGTPFAAWNGTEKLLSFDTIDNEGAIKACMEEANQHNGYLFVDPKAHLIKGTYDAEAPAHEHSYLEIPFEATEYNKAYVAHICEECGDYYETYAEEPTSPFEDVATDAYYLDAVIWAAENGITNGVDATHFAPEKDCTRAQVITMIWRAEGCPKASNTTNPFKDVKTGAYYYDAVLWAVEEGITNGTSATTFSPNATVTRAQSVTFLYRAAGEPEVAGAENPFEDVAANAYYYNAVMWAVENGITNGVSDTTFEPNTTCIRCQIATFIFREYGAQA